MSEAETGTLRPAALRVKQAAQYIGMSERWLVCSDVPRIRLTPRATVYLIADLDKYLTDRRSHGTAA